MGIISKSIRKANSERVKKGKLQRRKLLNDISVLKTLFNLRLCNSEWPSLTVLLLGRWNKNGVGDVNTHHPGDTITIFLLRCYMNCPGLSSLSSPDQSSWRRAETRKPRVGPTEQLISFPNRLTVASGWRDVREGKGKWLLMCMGFFRRW